MEESSEYLSVKDRWNRARSLFHEQFKRTLVYELLSPMGKSQAARLQRLEEACWDFRRFETRSGLKGARAARALSTLLRFRQELGEPIWLPENVAAALDYIAEDLQVVASAARKGRPRDSLGQAFRRNMEIFLSPAVLTKDGYRTLPQEEMDRILNDLFGVTMGRALSFDSYVRMRKREQAVEKMEILESCRRAVALRNGSGKGEFRRDP
ncbi:MAG TPA: hypothetical protein VE957_13785 [Terriglobales bacterium]|nr:hypothetical protein [Terriglobales bacterium]HYW39180.1 hypothetical protein [Terriglobales bacterium]